MAIPIELTTGLVIDYRSREWCKLPYPDHPHGCPNYNYKATCPPRVCLVEDYIDLDRPLWLVVEPFDLASHISRMRTKHPDWSVRQLKCVLYWQGGVNSRLGKGCQELASAVGGIYTICPEAMGVQVIKTTKRTGIPIKPRPDGYVFKVGLVGFKKEVK